MYDIVIDGKRQIIDLREAIKNGAHPRHEMFEIIKAAEVGTILEIYTPRRPVPLIRGFEDLGLNVVVDELAPDKIRVITVKMDEI